MKKIISKLIRKELKKLIKEELSNKNFESKNDFYKENNIDPDNLQWLGSGDFGNAYSIGDGRVLKKTSSKKEFAIAEDLLGRNIPHLAHIFSVGKIKLYNYPEELYIILEELEEDSSIEDMYYELMNICEEQGVSIEHLNYLNLDDIELDEDMINFIDTIESIYRACMNNGIRQPDIRPENLGRSSDGEIKLFDIDDKDRRLEEQIVNNLDNNNLITIDIMKDIKDVYKEWSEPMTLNSDSIISSNLKYHLENKISLGECVFRYGSEKYFNLLSEVKHLHKVGKIKLNENDEFIISEHDEDFFFLNGEKIKLNFIFEDTDSEDTINEAEYQGREVELNKPKRGGSSGKKFYVYVKNPKTGKIKKVSFGAKDGGGNLAVKLRDPKARKRFADRHNCEQKNDKTTPGFWSCRIPRFSKQLNLSGGGKWW